jgi:excisionase family DNA binding protein
VIALVTDDRRLAVQLALALMLLRKNLEASGKTLHPLLAELERYAGRIALRVPACPSVALPDAGANGAAYLHQREVLTVREVAQLTGWSRKTIRQRCHAGALAGAKKDGSQWRIPAAAITNDDNHDHED